MKTYEVELERTSYIIVTVEAENEALAIAQARAHLAGLLRDKIVQEFE